MVGQFRARRWMWLLTAISLLAILIASGPYLVRAQATLEQYFPETGHYVRGEYLLAYRRASNPLLVYGYPISSAFKDPRSGREVQYFQKARFEYHPELPVGQRVVPTPLGEYLYRPGKPYQMPPNPSPCRLIDRFPVCFAFLTFFDANGGLTQFGPPTSAIEIDDGVMVQSFRYARLEWHPEYPAGHQVVVSNLGYQYFILQKEDMAFLEPEPADLGAQTILQLKVKAFPQQAVTSGRGSQTVFVIVRDQRGLPVANARITLLVKMPGGEQIRYIVPEITNASGITRYTFPFAIRQTGSVEIRVTATWETLQASTVTSFRIWR